MESRTFYICTIILWIKLSRLFFNLFRMKKNARNFDADRSRFNIFPSKCKRCINANVLNEELKYSVYLGQDKTSKYVLYVAGQILMSFCPLCYLCTKVIGLEESIFKKILIFGQSHYFMHEYDVRTKKIGFMPNFHRNMTIWKLRIAHAFSYIAWFIK